MCTDDNAGGEITEVGGGEQRRLRRSRRAMEREHELDRLRERERERERVKIGKESQQ